MTESVSDVDVVTCTVVAPICVYVVVTGIYREMVSGYNRSRSINSYSKLYLPLTISAFPFTLAVLSAALLILSLSKEHASY